MGLKIYEIWIVGDFTDPNSSDLQAVFPAVLSIIPTGILNSKEALTLPYRR